MNVRTQPGDGEKWVKAPSPSDRPEAGDDAWLAAEIGAGCAELDAGQGIPAEQVWKNLGLD